MLAESLSSNPEAGDRRVLNGSTDLTADLGLESIQIMEFVVEIEDRYDISIALKSLSRAKTIHDLAQVVSSELGGPA